MTAAPSASGQHPALSTVSQLSGWLATYRDNLTTGYNTDGEYITAGMLTAVKGSDCLEQSWAELWGQN